MDISETDNIKPEAVPIVEDAPPPLFPPMLPPQTELFVPAGFVRRALAFIIDFIFLGFLYLIPFAFGLLGLYLSKGAVADLTALFAPFVSIWLVLFIGYFTFFHVHSGQTPAKQIVRIKVVNKKGAHLSHCAGLFRSFLSLFFLAFFSVIFLMIIFGKKKQGLHDMLASSYVVLS